MHVIYANQLLTMNVLVYIHSLDFPLIIYVTKMDISTFLNFDQQ